MKFNRPVIAAAMIAVFLVTAYAPATALAGVIMGELKAVPESRVDYSWGDGQHNLIQQWSAANNSTSGYVYGTNYSWSNADVYNAGRINPLSVTNAAAFAYTKGSVFFTEGDALFFRGANGYYGAWLTQNVYPTGSGSTPSAYLDAGWYFQSDGTSSFVPEPGSIAVAALFGMLTVARRRRREAAGRQSPLACARD
jgi:hypothetical protein